MVTRSDHGRRIRNQNRALDATTDVTAMVTDVRIWRMFGATLNERQVRDFWYKLTWLLTIIFSAVNYEILIDTRIEGGTPTDIHADMHSTLVSLVMGPGPFRFLEL